MSFKQLTLEQINTRIAMYKAAISYMEDTCDAFPISIEQSLVVAKEIRLLLKRFEKAQAIKLRKAAGTPPKYRIPSLNK